MNNEQLSDFLIDLSNTTIISNDKRDEVELNKKFLSKTASNTFYAINYISSNYTDVDLIQTIIGQILSLYYKGGVLRCYALQYVPGFVSLYLLALSKKQQKSAALFETFFIAIYNEEIMTEPKSDKKKVEEVRIPSIRHRSIYHDPTKIQTHPEVATIRPNMAAVYATVRIGPYPSIAKVTGETKFLILSRVLESVTQILFLVASEVVSRQICLTTMSICRSGFNFPETNFRNKVLENDMSQEIIEDFSRKPRQHVSSNLLQELLSGCYLALFNGNADLALRAIDAIYLRAQYECLPSTLLAVNAVRNSLLDNPLSKEKRDELMWNRAHKSHGRKELVTNASLRMKRMPEDIPVQEQLKEKEQSRLGELVEEGMDHLHDLKSKVKMGLHHKMHRRRKSIEHDDGELPAINEEDVKKISLNVEEIEQRLKDVGVVELDYSKKEEADETGAFGVGGLRHMDSGSSTCREN